MTESLSRKSGYLPDRITKSATAKQAWSIHCPTTPEKQTAKNGQGEPNSRRKTAKTAAKLPQTVLAEPEREVRGSA